MKVLIATEYFTPHWTGIAKACMALAKNLQSQGNDVTVMTTWFDSQLPAEESIDGIKILRISWLIKISRSHFSLQTIWHLVKSVSQYDWVVINSPHANILPLTLIAKISGRKVAIFHQGDLNLPRKTGFTPINYFIEKIFDFSTSYAMAWADRVSCSTLDYAQNSRVMKKHLHKFAAFIPGLALSTGKVDQKLIKKINELKKNGPLLGVAGRFVEEKGFDTLLRSLPLVLKEIPKVRIVFAGETNIEYESFFSSLSPLTQKYKDNLTFLGLLSEPELSFFYKNLDLYITPSRSDCFPLAQMEAALSGVPLLCTDIPGARMLVKETGVGLLTPVDNLPRMAESIVNLIKNNSRFRRRQKEVREYFKKNGQFKLD